MTTEVDFYELLECDRKAKRDTHCEDKTPLPPIKVPPPPVDHETECPNCHDRYRKELEGNSFEPKVFLFE